ncbi:DUF4349 domain-containing protein [Nocardioides marmoriginsengisoli]|uniref:DUF4349 domain-containing protein n=1 Tax=Nocardioides marmoriginsengisoli TaxID=661483 RepID=A0A3N0CL65_9ACTN|nr:DUF4349 domain-containing protein [Nocardioides marmoriginsengisoli]RNL64188.1 DUF4349 domain-containing protein [Nocardioides marmoriginsengisoli]
MKISRVALAVPAVLLVAACGASGSDTMTPASAPDAAPADTQRGSGAADAPETANLFDTAGAKDADAIVAQTKAIISKGQISLHAKDVDKARFDLRKLLDGLDGTIANEESTADDDGDTERIRLELRVPSARFDEAMDSLTELGTLVDRKRTSEDVTTQVIDNNARVRSQKLSLERIRALLAQAKTLNQVISIEEQLSQRQAELDSLEQQQKYLADQTSLATIGLYLSRPDDEAAGDDEDDTFLSGLKNGWEHLGSATSAVLTGLGTVLPFAAVLALVVLVGRALSGRWTRARGRSAA